MLLVDTLEPRVMQMRSAARGGVSDLERTSSAYRSCQLSELPLPTPRKIAYFYAHIASIQDDLARLATELGPGRRTERIRRVLAELDDALALGDAILRELRRLLSPKHQKSLTRA